MTRHPETLAAAFTRINELEVDLARARREAGQERDGAVVLALQSHDCPRRLTPKEAELLATLWRRPNTVCTKGALLASLYGEDDGERDLSIIDVFVSRIRAKIGFGTIDTIWGRGYRLAPLGAEAVRVAVQHGSVA